MQLSTIPRSPRTLQARLSNGLVVLISAAVLTACSAKTNEQAPIQPKVTLDTTIPHSDAGKLSGKGSPAGIDTKTITFAIGEITEILQGIQINATKQQKEIDKINAELLRLQNQLKGKS